MIRSTGGVHLSCVACCALLVLDQPAPAQIQAMPPANSLYSQSTAAPATRGRITAVSPLGTRTSRGRSEVVAASATSAPDGVVPLERGYVFADNNPALPGGSIQPGAWLGSTEVPTDAIGPQFAPSFGAGAVADVSTGVYPWGGGCYTWQLLPEGLMYRSYLAGGREPRIGSQWFYLRGYGWLWDVTLGGRVGILRYGTEDAAWPEGFQVDIEGAGMPRLDAEHQRDLVSSDFRFGVPITARRGPWEAKLAYYHLSSHLGDEWMLSHPTLDRINYVRDCVVLGLAMRPGADWRLYAEAGYAFYINGGAEPWEFQFGIEYSPTRPSGILGAPFVATNAHLREENDFGGNFAAEAGWQWRGDTGRLFRIGAHYFNGFSDQYQFFQEFEDQLGLGAWYDY